MAVNVRFGSKADIEARQSDVRFTPKSGHLAPLIQSPCRRSREGWAVLISPSVFAIFAELGSADGLSVPHCC
jgi:hypothetical protein